MKTIQTPNFMSRIAKIIGEVRARTCIEDVDAEVLWEILQDELKELNEYCRMLDGYYEEKCSIAISRARNNSYYEGHSDGYSLGYDDGYLDGHSEGCDEGHSDGYYDGIVAHQRPRLP